MATYYPISSLTPTNLVNGIQGWNTRLIYAYYGSPAGAYDIGPHLSAGTELFGDLSAYTFPDTNYQPITKGFQNYYKLVTLTNRYFATGKNLRIRGRFLISTPPLTSPTFSMNVAVYNFGGVGDTTTTIASTNNGAGHLVSQGVDRAPLDFEIIITGIESQTDTPSSRINLYMQANGYFQYNIDPTDRNGTVIYVPIYEANGPNPYSVVGLVDDGSSNGVQIQLDGTDIDSLYVYYVTVEELE